MYQESRRKTLTTWREIFFVILCSTNTKSGRRECTQN